MTVYPLVMSPYIYACTHKYFYIHVGMYISWCTACHQIFKNMFSLLINEISASCSKNFLWTGKHTVECTLSRKNPECSDQVLHQALHQRAPRQSQPARPPSWIVQQVYEWKMVQRSNLILCSKVQQEAKQGEHSWSSPDAVPGSQPWLAGTGLRQGKKEDAVLWNGFLIQKTSI